MNRQEFLAELKGRLHALDDIEIKKTLAYYGEMIDDRVEEGMTEEQAIAGMESIGTIAEQVLQDVPLKTLIRAKKPQNISMGTIVLLVLGSPIWLPLLLALIVVVLAIYIVIWALILSLYAIVISLGIGGLACVLAVPFMIDPVSILPGLGVGMVLIGISVLLFMPMLDITKRLGRITAGIGRYIKSILIRKEVA